MTCSGPGFGPSAEQDVDVVENSSAVLAIVHVFLLTGIKGRI